jgi:hypothetical protein
VPVLSPRALICCIYAGSSATYITVRDCPVCTLITLQRTNKNLSQQGHPLHIITFRP